MSEFDDMLKKIGELSPTKKERALKALGKGEDVKHKQSFPEVANVAGFTNQQVRVSNFSGGEGKGDNVSYQQWRFEVRGLMRDGIHSEATILQAIRRSLRGVAADVLLHMGEDVTTLSVLEKMDRIFGDILPPEKLLEQFYVARQNEGEKVATWACCIEDILTKLRDKGSALVSVEGAQDMLRTKFIAGLRRELQLAVKHLFDAGQSYNQLLVAARVAEMEEERDKPARTQQVTTAEKGNAEKLDKILAQLNKMETRLQTLEKERTGQKNKEQHNQQQRQGGKGFQGQCFKCKQWGHRAAECPLNAKQSASGGRGQTEQGQAPQADSSATQTR